MVQRTLAFANSQMQRQSSTSITNGCEVGRELDELRNFRQSATAATDPSAFSQHLIRPKTAAYGLPSNSLNNQGKTRQKLAVCRKSVEAASSAKRKQDSKDEGKVPVKLKSRPQTAV